MRFSVSALQRITVTMDTTRGEELPDSFNEAKFQGFMHAVSDKSKNDSALTFGQIVTTGK
ncbi:hypothetical protein CCR75_009323 [Bremia lactucae]|uniref:Uncharacterized protein n=1 Tax=Bremia lactucae TaxID=4779 RepID=A0A976NZR4_BRELC|nr:hypothetical protein CCR75_009326 [Bremia lactucae]TDH73932.1 hypothetical protein CCR75_009323 [Bremia lactucae]